jgi:hypothetical protein
MIRVHVWLPDSEHVGHTALTIGREYVSFWPDGGADKKDIKIKRSQPGLFVQSLHEDIRNEGNRHPITVELSRLDMEAVLEYVADLRGVVPRYQIVRNNCSHVVARALMAGARGRPSFTPHAGQYSKLGKILGRGVWTPDQVLRFARELKEA